MKPLAQKSPKPTISTRNTPQTFTLNKLAKPIVRDDIFRCRLLCMALSI